MRARSLTVLGLVVSSIVFAPPASASTIVYAQGSTPTGYISSQTPFSVAFDDFSLSVSALITGVYWTGATVFPGDVQGFNITIWSDSGGPSVALNTTSLVGNANQTAAGAPFGVPLFTYFSALQTAFSATSGTTYWLSIVSDVANGNGWYWAADFLTTTGAPIQQDYFTLHFTYPADATIALESQAVVPEPTTMILVGSGVGLVLARRRRLSLLSPRD